jgi:hypothetical protein
VDGIISENTLPVYSIINKIISCTTLTHTPSAFMLVDRPVEEDSDEGFEIISWPTTPVTHITPHSNKK